MTLVRRIRPYLLSLLVLAGFGYGFLAISSYVDITHWCRIKIDDDEVLGGNRQTIIQAIQRLALEDPEAYQTLCRSVDTITEKRCLGADPRVAGYERGLQEPGCYIRGSRTVALAPLREGGDVAVADRATALKRYAQLSALFWESRQ